MKRATTILIAGDILALLVFVAIGQRDHELVNPENPILGVVLSGLQFVLPWIVIGALLGAFNLTTGDSADLASIRGRTMIARALNTWFVAAPLALLLRALVLGRAVIPTIFILVAMGLGGAFVIGWRLIFLAAVRLLGRQGSQTKSSVA